MTLFFIITGVFCAITVIYITKPLLKKENATHVQNSDVAYFAKQLKDLEISYKKDSLKKSEYTSIHAELSRALLCAQRETIQTTAHNFGRFESRFMWAILGIFPIAVFGIYIYSATLGMPDFPIAKRTEEINQIKTAQQQQQMIEGMVSSLKNRLTDEKPKDIKGWKKLIRSYGILKQLDKQAWAYAQWAKADKTDPVPLLLQARTLRTIANQKSTLETFTLMENVLKIDDTNIEALFLSALYLNMHNDVSDKGYSIDKRLKTLLQQFDKNSESYRQIKQKIDSIFK